MTSFQLGLTIYRDETSQLDLNAWQPSSVYTKSKALIALLTLSSFRSVFMSCQAVFSPTSSSYHPCGKRAASVPQRAQWTGTLWPPTGLWMTCILLRTWASLTTLGESSISSVQIVRLDQSAGTVWMTRKVSTSLWRGWIMHSQNAYVSPQELWKKCVVRLCIFSWISTQCWPQPNSSHTHTHTLTYIVYIVYNRIVSLSFSSVILGAVWPSCCNKDVFGEADVECHPG